eukprot:NODE_147_length_17537_cov_0.265627.p12 type:complete len:169 gc:universal NODE_147_length_17537_cov_0.265627:11375-11881(+)
MKLDFLKVAQQKLNLLKEPLSTHQQHLECLKIVQIPVKNWQSFKLSSQYYSYLDSYFNDTEKDLSNMLKWHIMYSNKDNSNVQLSNGISERIKFTPDLQEQAEKITDPLELVKFTINNLSPLGPLKVLPTRHIFRQWFLQQDWPPNVSFKPFVKQNKNYKVSTSDLEI